MRSIQQNIDSILSRPVKPGITTGIECLDEAIKGLQPEHIITIGGCSSMGKSSLMRSMIIAAASEVPVGVFPIEGGTYTNVDVMLYSIAKINYHKKGNLDKLEQQEIDKAKKTLKKLKPIYFDESARTMYPQWILDKDQKQDSIELSMQKMYDQGAKVFFIDYLQLINWGFKYESEALRIKEFTGKLAQKAIDYKLPIVLLAQLKKAVADRAVIKDMDPTPTLNDLRDSGFITNDSHEILLLHRPEYFEKPKDLDLLANCREEAKIIVAKQRFGPTGALTVQFEPSFMLWSDMNKSGSLF